MYKVASLGKSCRFNGEPRKMTSINTNGGKSSLQDMLFDIWSREGYKAVRGTFIGE
jgi:hypothetical protein